MGVGKNAALRGFLATAWLSC